MGWLIGAHVTGGPEAAATVPLMAKPAPVETAAPASSVKKIRGVFIRGLRIAISTEVRLSVRQAFLQRFSTLTNGQDQGESGEERGPFLIPSHPPSREGGRAGRFVGPRRSGLGTARDCRFLCPCHRPPRLWNHPVTR